MEWASIAEVRKKADVSETDFTDDEISEFIAWATKEVNSRVIKRKVREPVQFMDSYRSNKIDGVNKTYFIKNWKGNYLADANFDNVIDVTDLKLVQYDHSTTLETELVIDSIDYELCSFNTNIAPYNVDLFIDYSYISLDPEMPHPFLEKCTTYLAASTLLIGTDGFEVKFGNVSIKPGKEGGKGKQLMDQYNSLLDQLLILSNGGALYSDMAVKI